MSKFESFSKRLKALIDKSALILIIPALIAMYFIDPAMAKTLVDWTVFAPIMAGIAVVVSRIVFHRIELTKLIILTEKGNMAAAVLASSIVLFVAIVFMALVMWVKA